jgi:hypothetical protein
MSSRLAIWTPPLARIRAEDLVERSGVTQSTDVPQVQN